VQMAIPSLAVVAVLLVVLLCQPGAVQGANSKSTSGKQDKKKAVADVNDNKGNTPFFLQDPYDQMCLGPHGFTICDERALWILTKRKGKKTYSLVSLLNPSPYGMCLSRQTTLFGLFKTDNIGMGLCSKKDAMEWEFEFADQHHVRLSTGNHGQCLVRGKKRYKNSASLQSCKKGEYLPLLYHPTAVHEAGFYLKGWFGISRSHAACALMQSGVVPPSQDSSLPPPFRIFM
jgi:hypothetical protein